VVYSQRNCNCTEYNCNENVCDRKQLLLLRVELPYAVFGLVFEQGRCIQCPPIARFAHGKTILHILEYYRNKGATFEVAEEEVVNGTY